MEEEILRKVQQQQQSRFHDFSPPPVKSVPPVKTVPTIIETTNVSDDSEPELEPEPEQKAPKADLSDEIPEEIDSPEQKPNRMALLDPMDHDPAILSDNSDIAYETLEVEFIDDDADWEDDEFDDEQDDNYSGDESPEPDDIESPVSHDEEEEEVVSDVDDTDLMARLEAKYGKLN